jgi:hypothetical protein
MAGDQLADWGFEHGDIPEMNGLWTGAQEDEGGLTRRGPPEQEMGLGEDKKTP